MRSTLATDYTWPLSWTATAAGRLRGGCRAWPAIGPARRPCGEPSNRRLAGHFGVDALCVFRRQLAPSAARISALMKLLGRYLVQESDRCVANGVRLEAIGGATGCRRHWWRCSKKRSAKRRARTKTAFAAGDRLFLAPGDFGRGAARRRGFVGASGAGCRSADPDQRGAAFERFSAVGMRLRGDGFYPPHVAGVFGAGSSRGHRRISAARTKIRSGRGADSVRLQYLTCPGFA